jgi:hypothetical protein
VIGFAVIVAACGGSDRKADERSEGRQAFTVHEPDGGGEGSDRAGLTVTVGDETTIVSSETRHRLDLENWPDMSLGVRKLAADQHRFITSNSTEIAVTDGTLDDPVAAGVTDAHIIIGGKPAMYDYAAGGEVYTDLTSPDLMIMIYHAEQWANGNERNFYATLNLAVSTDDGGSWQHLGQIVTPAASYQAWLDRPQRESIALAGGTFALVEDQGVRYFYVYFDDDEQRPGGGPMSVARAPVDDVINAAGSGGTVPWFKYHEGRWSQPGVGGLSTAVFTDPGSQVHWPYFPGVSYNSYLGQYIMVTSTSRASSDEDVSTQLRISFSHDGLHWSPSELIAQATPDELMYPSIIGTGDDPLVSGRSFFVYYIRSELGGWESGEELNVNRRTITLEKAPRPQS